VVEVSSLILLDTWANYNHGQSQTSNSGSGVRLDHSVLAYASMSTEILVLYISFMYTHVHMFDFVVRFAQGHVWPTPTKFETSSS
jgi:hypothetical protein